MYPFWYIDALLSSNIKTRLNLKFTFLNIMTVGHNESQSMHQVMHLSLMNACGPKYCSLKVESECDKRKGGILIMVEF